MTVREKLNRTTRAIAALDGWIIPENYDFERQSRINPRAAHYWKAACAAWKEITGKAPHLKRRFTA